MKAKWSYIFSAFLGLFCYGLMDNSRGPLYPEILEHYSITPKLGALMFSITSFSGLIVNLLSKRWLPRFGAVKSIRFFLLSQVVGIFGMGLSGMLGHYWFLLAMSFIFGLSSGGTGVCMNVLIFKGAPSRILRRCFSGLHSMYGIASFIAPILISFTSKFGIEWWKHLMILSSVPMAAFIYTLSLTPDTTVREDKALTTSVPFFLRFLAGGTFGLYVASEIAVSSRMVFYAKSIGFDSDKSAYFLSVFFVCLLAGRVLLSVKPPKMESWKLLILSLSFSAVLSSLGLMIHPLFLAGCGFTMSIYFPCATEWLKERFPGDEDYMITTAMTAIGVMLVSMHWVIGLIADQASISVAMFCIPLFLLSSLAMLLGVEAKIKKVG